MSQAYTRKTNHHDDRVLWVVARVLLCSC